MAQKLKFYQIDSFTTKKYSGNPAGVILCQDTWPDNIQKIAAEINQNETAFVLSDDAHLGFSSSQKFKLRWLTPTCEVNLCGHATLAAATVIFEECGNNHESLSFESKSGLLKATNTENGVRLDFPVDIPEEFSHDDVSKSLSVIGDGELNNRLESSTIKLGLKTKKLLVQINGTQENLNWLETIPVPNAAKLLASHDGTHYKGICITMLGQDIPNCPHDIISRYFAPWNGLNEDHVTGSLHTTLAPFYMVDRKVTGKSIFARQCSPRNGEMVVSWEGDRVYLDGKVAKVIEGLIDV